MSSLLNFGAKSINVREIQQLAWAAAPQQYPIWAFLLSLGAWSRVILLGEHRHCLFGATQSYQANFAGLQTFSTFVVVDCLMSSFQMDHLKECWGESGLDTGRGQEWTVFCTCVKGWRLLSSPSLKDDVTFCCSPSFSTAQLRLSAKTPGPFPHPHLSPRLCRSAPFCLPISGSLCQGSRGSPLCRRATATCSRCAFGCLPNKHTAAYYCLPLSLRGCRLILE